MNKLRLRQLMSNANIRQYCRWKKHSLQPHLQSLTHISDSTNLKMISIRPKTKQNEAFWLIDYLV